MTAPSSRDEPTKEQNLDAGMQELGPLANVKVRQALDYAVDRKGINATTVLEGVGQPPWALWPAGSNCFPPNLKGYYAFNLKKARQLMAQAGFAKGFSTEVLCRTAQPFVERRLA